MPRFTIDQVRQKLVTSQVELNRVEEKRSKQKAKQLFESGDITQMEEGTFAGQVRDVNLAKGNFRFAPVMYLQQSLAHISAMPQQSFDHIIEKYVEMNVAHPFREGNGRATRIWLDLMLKKELQRVIDWNAVDKAEYLSAMERSVVKDLESKHLLNGAFTDQINDRALYSKGIDVSYYYEGYSEYKVEDL